LNSLQPVVGIIMGSTSDWGTMKLACEILQQFEVPFESKVVSAHRSPQLMSTYAQEAKNRGLKVIIAGAGGAAHLPGMVAANTTLPVIGVPIQSNALNGIDSLLSIVQMPAGVPVATVAIGNAGAKNAAILATQILANENEQLSSKLEAFKIEARIKSERSSEELIDVE
jgi:5-(carboxyamino)imidazole ribonucleotide mutase